MPERFSASPFWRWAADHRCTWLNVVPTIIAYLLNGRDPEGDLSAERFCRSASAPLAAEHQLAFESRLGIGVVETIPFAASTNPKAIRADNKILVSGFAFSRALSGRLGPFDETLPIYWDWDWYLRLHAAGVAFHDLGPQAIAIYAHRRATSGDGRSRLRADNLAALRAKHGLGPLTLRNHESIARDEAAGR